MDAVRARSGMALFVCFSNRVLVTNRLIRGELVYATRQARFVQRRISRDHFRARLLCPHW